MTTVWHVAVSLRSMLRLSPTITLKAISETAPPKSDSLAHMGDEDLTNDRDREVDRVREELRRPVRDSQRTQREIERDNGFTQGYLSQVLRIFLKPPFYWRIDIAV